MLFTNINKPSVILLSHNGFSSITSNIDTIASSMLFTNINQYQKQMYSNFKMLEATNKEEAIVSILDVIEENPLWLNKITDGLFILVKSIELEHKRFLLERSLDEQVIDLFVKLKTEYYNFKDNTQWNY
jgi:hypothetical protein